MSIMIDAVTLKFPYFPASGYTREYMDSKDFIFEDMALKLNTLHTGRAPQSMLILGEKGAGKTAMMKQLQDIAQRRHGGCPALMLEQRDGQSIFKSMTDKMLTVLDKPAYATAEFDNLKEAVKKVGTLANKSPAAFKQERPDMHDLLESLGRELKAAKLPIVLFIDDADTVGETDYAFMIHWVADTQRDGLPVMFVNSCPEQAMLRIVKVRPTDGRRLFNGYDVYPQQK